MAYHLWTEAEAAELKRLTSEGKNTGEIAKVLGRKYESVRNKKKKLNLRTFPFERWTATEIELLIELVRQDKTGYEIANALGRNYKAVNSKKKRLGLCKPTLFYEFWSEHELRRLRRYCKKGYSLDRICTYFPSRIRRVVRDRVWKITRYWMTPGQKEERRLAKEREWQWRVW